MQAKRLADLTTALVTDSLLFREFSDDIVSGPMGNPEIAADAPRVALVQQYLRAELLRKGDRFRLTAIQEVFVMEGIESGKGADVGDRLNSYPTRFDAAVSIREDLIKNSLGDDHHLEREL